MQILYEIVSGGSNIYIQWIWSEFLYPEGKYLINKMSKNKETHRVNT